jgi:hypothetical protein
VWPWPWDTVISSNRLDYIASNCIKWNISRSTLHFSEYIIYHCIESYFLLCLKQRRNLTDIETLFRFHAIQQGHWQEVNRRCQENKLAKQHQQLKKIRPCTCSYWYWSWSWQFTHILSGCRQPRSWASASAPRDWFPYCFSHCVSFWNPKYLRWVWPYFGKTYSWPGYSYFRCVTGKNME